MNRMFQVIVVGGIALTADACGSPAAVADNATSGSGGSAGSTASVGAGGFPTVFATSSSTTASSSGLGPFDPPDAGPLADGGGDGSADAWSFPGEAQ
jgi:hypothetical protein